MNAPHRNNEPSIASYQKKAEKRLSRFRNAGRFSIALTALFLFFSDSYMIAQPGELESEAVQSLGALSGLLKQFLNLLPRLGIAMGVFFLCWAFFFVFRVIYEKLQKQQQKRLGIVSVARLVFFVLGVVLALTVLTGDVRALLGSVGLIGLALSWALQQPIESFSGFLLNAFRSYYRTGDRIQVGTVYGDVYRTDFLTTTVWEAGAPGKSVSGAQPTGALVTFPNSEVLRTNITNYSRDFPYIWDEITIGIANESDLAYTIMTFQKVAEDLIGASMKPSAIEYQELLRGRGLNYHVDEKPQVYLSGAQSWTDCTIRYLVELRKRRTWSSQLYEQICSEMTKDEHAGKIMPAYPVSIIRQN